MKILVLSDSHSSLRFMRLALQKIRPDAFIHLGDYYQDAQAMAEEFPEIPGYFVAGNCDWSAHCDRELRLNVEGKRLLLTHGDRFGVKYGYDRLSYYAEESMMDAVLFGHTHRPFAGYVGRALLINPGALKNGSLCVLDISPRDIVPRILDIDQWTPPKTGADEEGDTLL
mgnify:CR=1 FL=1